MIPVNRRAPVSTLHLLVASIVVMLLLIGVKSNELVRAVLLPAAQAESAPPASQNPAGQNAGKMPDGGSNAVTPSAAVPISAALVSDSERQLLEALRARKQELDAREKTLATREAALDAAEQRVAARVQELQTLQDNLEKLQRAASQKDDTDWKNLVAVYQAMKPQAAAAILNNLDMSVLIQIFSRMQNRKAAEILAAMNADRARALTVELAKTRAIPANPAASNS